MKRTTWLVCKITRDITERKQAREKLNEIEDQLVASQKLEAVGQLSGRGARENLQRGWPGNDH
jgi:C4-dicarboxylate-specific signal transduction histidine kinase